ncbi:hypothetical protein STA1M1_07120 [Sinisalibacter aestuarii]|uniref:Uncharacterized protein n=1 Tax=Sinisalibacter aestuarii TaxID=2949426 RepID=A0ABQ5LPF8_9RHOB|nr:hypothetical protein STA1M1_07120 [Sinisalibacter aestuarii]
MPSAILPNAAATNSGSPAAMAAANGICQGRSLELIVANSRHSLAATCLIFAQFIVMFPTTRKAMIRIPRTRSDRSLQVLSPRRTAAFDMWRYPDAA